MDYRLGFHTENPEAMSQPRSNISTQGELPQSPAGWCHALPLLQMLLRQPQPCERSYAVALWPQDELLSLGGGCCLQLSLLCLVVFRVDLVCSGKVEEEAVLTVQLNLTTPTSNYMVLNFKRSKMCYKSKSERPRPPGRRSRGALQEELSGSDQEPRSPRPGAQVYLSTEPRVLGARG